MPDDALYQESLVEEWRDKAFDALAALETANDNTERLAEALEAICNVPSERTLLLNAEARAMYEYARRALDGDA